MPNQFEKCEESGTLADRQGRDAPDHCLYDSLLLHQVKMRIHGQGENFRSKPFRCWKVPWLVTQVFVRFLEMERNGVVNARHDIPE